MSEGQKKQNWSPMRNAESWGPSAVAVMILVFLLFSEEWVIAALDDRAWPDTGLHMVVYSLHMAVLGLVLVQGVFILRVNFLTNHEANGFLQKIRNTRAMIRFGEYMMESAIALLIFSLAGVLQVVNEGNYLFPALWFSLFIWSFLTFLRLVWILRILARVRNVAFHGA